MQNKVFDLVVIGGGINGAGVARDAAGRGLSVLLCEKDDLASGTSSASTKLIHGGLRYLEHFEFKLVRESLKEREVLLNAAPHIIWPLEFVLPICNKVRPVWMIRVGLFLYDWLAGRKRLKPSRRINLAVNSMGAPLNSEFKTGFCYSDCWVDDSRLVVLNAVSAYEHGAKILTRTECIGFETEPQDTGMVWRVHLKSKRQDESFSILAHSIINAAGPRVNTVLEGTPNLNPQYKTRLVKGSHFVIPKLYSGDQAYIFQNTDNRVVFAIPYERNYTLIGTTEVNVSDSESLKISQSEIDYLCTVVNTYFRKTVDPSDIVWTYSGVRPLIDEEGKENSEVTRDYVLSLDRTQGAPVLNIYGGKLTTYRTLSEEAVTQVVSVLHRGGKPWTRSEVLPGGNLGTIDFDTFFNIFRKEFHFLSDALALRYARAYGARARKMLRGCHRASDMGAYFGDDVYEAEIRYLVDYEWARSTDDIIWRRSKLGLHISDDTRKNISAFLRKYRCRNIESAA